VTGFFLAAAAMLAAARGDHQAALMAPTELLAEQHHASLQRWLSPLGLDVVLLSGKLKKREREARMAQVADGSARIHGSLRSGEGTLALDGKLGWRDDPASGKSTPLVLNVRGSNVLASDTRDLHAVIDPDLVVRYAAGQPLAVSGTVGVPSARIDLERLDQGVSTSPDVVVLDPVDPERGVATPLQLDLTLALGDDVRLDGFGLDGTLDGSLRVRARPGSEMLASGTLEVGGRYTAYGQKLDISRGRLVWTGSPIADPLLDIRAQREVGDVTAGIDVSGRASRIALIEDLVRFIRRQHGVWFATCDDVAKWHGKQR